MAELPVRVHKPEGALFLWLWFEGLPVTTTELYRELMDQGVFVLPSRPFFPDPAADWRHQDECIRVNYAGPEAMVSEGIALIAEAVRSKF